MESIENNQISNDPIINDPIINDPIVDIPILFPKGKMCSVSGNNYEKQVHSIVHRCTLYDIPFNTQNVSDLGSSTNKNDIVCNLKSTDGSIDKTFGIEIKRYNTPDWMQCSISFDEKLNKWTAHKIKSKIPIECYNIFEGLLNHINLFNGNIPPFIHKHITYDEWLSIKKSNHIWNDLYIDIPNNTIQKLYSIKGCKYIQLSNGYGLYHLGHDICNFNVPEFIIDQQLRIRVKVHSRKNKNGFCNLSITAACQPKKIKLLTKSPYSLDNIQSLPLNLTYHTLLKKVLSKRV